VKKVVEQVIEKKEDTTEIHIIETDENVKRKRLHPSRY
jgi:hypothetical protein